MLFRHGLGVPMRGHSFDMLRSCRSKMHLSCSSCKSASWLAHQQQTAWPQLLSVKQGTFRGVGSLQCAANPHMRQCLACRPPHCFGMLDV